MDVDLDAKVDTKELGTEIGPEVVVNDTVISPPESDVKIVPDKTVDTKIAPGHVENDIKISQEISNAQITLDENVDAKIVDPKDVENDIKISREKPDAMIAHNEDVEARIAPGDVENNIKISPDGNSVGDIENDIKFARTKSNTEISLYKNVNEKVTHRDNEIHVEIVSAESDVEVAPDENMDVRIPQLSQHEEATCSIDIHDPEVQGVVPDISYETLDVEMASATQLLGVEPPILKVNIQFPSKKSKIQKVPALLLQNPNFARYCSPKIISFGPIHHDREDHDLQLGQEFKYLWAFRYIQQSAKDLGSLAKTKENLYKKVTGNLDELKTLFNKDVILNYKDKELAHMLFVDGCALLYFMNHMNIDETEERLALKLDQLLYIWRDIILLENQLPVKLLKMLLVASKQEREFQLDNLMFNFLFTGLQKKKKESILIPKRRKHGKESTHLLDFIHSCYSFSGKENSPDSGMDVPSSTTRNVFWRSLLDMVVPSEIKKAFRSLREADSWHRYKNIGELRKAGIGVKTSKAEWRWDNISFKSGWFRGQLMLPGIVVDDIALYLYHNLIAYEMCPDFSNNFEFCSYFALMDSLIDDAEDVKELRAAGVLQNLLGSDEEVAKLFNELGHILPSKLFDSDSYGNRSYVEVKRQIDEHYRNKWKTCWAQLHSTYFNTPWSYFAFFAAVAALALTFIQTWYTIHPK